MILCRAATILVYLCFVNLDNMRCCNISWIQPIKANEFRLKTNMGIQFITSAILRNYVNMTVRNRERIVSKYKKNILWIMVLTGQQKIYLYHSSTRCVITGIVESTACLHLMNCVILLNIVIIQVPELNMI